jgi:iron complex outermembrane receptor protein
MSVQTPVQERVSVRVEVRAADAPVGGARVSAGGVQAMTGEDGTAALSLASGRIEITVAKDGFLPATVTADVTSAPGQVVRVELRPRPDVEEEVTVIASTRTGRRLDDQPTRVEVIGREEIEEKLLMTPGDIVMMLNELGGLRVQATSPSLGAASVRIQGMRGRFTRMLSDGLPLFGEQPGGLGLLQIPPMDLGQVEVIKGAASALYGAGAMGGVVNLISRRPGDTFEREALVNRTTRGGTDGILWLSGPLTERWSATFLAGAHDQRRADVDADGWADLPGYTRGIVRPRIFWDDGEGRSLLATAGATWEERIGGTMPGAIAAPVGAAHREALDTRRVDAGVVVQSVVGPQLVLSARAAFANQRHDHEFGDRLERDRHRTAFAEASLRGAAGRHTWVAGLAVDDDRFESQDLPRFNYAFTTPGLFVQDDIDAGRVSLSLGGRLDRHSAHGWFFSPRAAVRVPAGSWTMRAAAGLGFSAPTPLTEETEAAGLTRLAIPAPLEAERGRSASFDITRTVGFASLTATVFGSSVHDPAQVDRDTFELRTLDSPTTTAGAELLLTIHREPFALTGTYAYVRARERSTAGNADVPLTPRHSAGLVAMIESEDAGRLGLEVYVTGRQRLEANPYRPVSAPYVIVGVLAERRLGRVRLFINGENLTGVRQSRFDPLLRPAPDVDGRLTVDAWAPLDGRTINGGLRVRF